MHRFLHKLARFSSGASPDDAGNMVQMLLTVPLDSAFDPIISSLIDRSKQVRAELRPWRRLPTALFQYRRGQLAGALHSIDQDLAQTDAHAKTQAASTRALALFLKSAVNEKLGDRPSAVKAYKDGLQFHSPALRTPGIAYGGEDFWDACGAEIMRREAATLLGAEAPTD